MTKKSDSSNLKAGDCLILKASKQEFWIHYIDDKTIYLGTEHNSVHFPKNKLSRYFAYRKVIIPKVKNKVKQ
jgi:hypothetical protein